MEPPSQRSMKSPLDMCHTGSHSTLSQQSLQALQCHPGKAMPRQRPERSNLQRWTAKCAVTGKETYHIQCGRGSVRAAPASSHPSVHCLHAVSPSTSMNVPGAHFVQLSWRTSSLYVPALQLVASAEPTGQKVPRSQITQSSTLVITLSERFLCVPPGHGRGAADRSAQ